MAIFEKYNKDTEKSITYNTVIAIGKTRKPKLRDEKVEVILDEPDK